MHARSALAAALALCAIAVAGCGGTVLDDEGTEETVRAYLEKSRDEKLRSIDCPSDEPVDPGLVIECDVELSGGERKVVAVKILNEDADIDIVSYRVAQ